MLSSFNPSCVAVLVEDLSVSVPGGGKGCFSSSTVTSCISFAFRSEFFEEEPPFFTSQAIRVHNSNAVRAVIFIFMTINFCVTVKEMQDFCFCTKKLAGKKVRIVLKQNFPPYFLPGKKLIHFSKQDS